MEVRLCIKCGLEINSFRLQAIPTTRTCTSCSTESRVAGFNIISGKTTYSEIQLMSQEEAQELYLKQDRKGGVSEGVKFKNLPAPKISNLE